MHRTLAQVLRSLLLNSAAEEWADKLPYVELAINSNPNVSTNKPAFELLYGENVQLPIDLALGTHSDTTYLPTSTKFV